MSQRLFSGSLRRGMTRERRAVMVLVGVVLAATVVQFLWLGATRLFDGPSADCGRALGSWPSAPLLFIVGGVLGLALLSLPLGHRLHRKGALLTSSGAVLAASAASLLFVVGWWAVGHSAAESCGGVAGFFGPLLPIALVGLISGFLFLDTLGGGQPQPLAED